MHNNGMALDGWVVVGWMDGWMDGGKTWVKY